MAEELIVTLEAKAGKNAGEAIGTYKGYHLVFMPRGIELDKEYRVKLIEVKNDSRGRMMYRGIPAPDIYSESWRDNGDGTGSRISVATDWQGTSVEVGVLETRQLQRREVPSSPQSKYQYVWGNDLASSKIEDHQYVVVRLEEEKISNFQISWQKIGERQDQLPIISSQLNKAEIKWGSGFISSNGGDHRLGLNYDDSKQIYLQCDYDDKSDSGHWHEWGTLPSWIKDQVLARYPKCSCGRQRYDTQNSDKYAKCEKCREEEVCIRCGKTARVKNLDSRLICSSCEPYETREQMINKFLPVEKRVELAEQAKKLLSVEAVPQIAGEIILKATLAHPEYGWYKDSFIRNWSGNAYYYFCSDGVYGSRFSPTALQILAYLPQAGGNGLVEMINWLKPGDWYDRSQVKGETGLPSLSESDLGRLEVAKRLRGSETDRIAALSGYDKVAAQLGSDQRVEEVKQMLFKNLEQDYGVVLLKLAEIEKELNRQNNGEILINFGGHYRHSGRTGNHDYWVVRPDGSFRDCDGGCSSKVWKNVEPEELALEWSKSTSASSHEFKVAKLPVNGCTDAQLKTVEKLERKLDDAWRGCRGMASGTESPPVGNGWGLTEKKPSAKEDEDNLDDTEMARAFRKAGILK